MIETRFETFTDVAGEHRFRLRAGNAEIVMVSEGYATAAGRDKAIGDLIYTVNDARRADGTIRIIRQ